MKNQRQPNESVVKELNQLPDKDFVTRFKDIYKWDQTYDIVKRAVSIDGMLLERVSKRLVSEEVYRIAVIQNEKAIQYIPEESRTQDLCELAIESNGDTLQYVPIKFKTKELCKIAIENNGNALQYVPAKIKTKELCKTAINNDVKAFIYMPKTFQNRVLCNFVISKDGNLLSEVSKKHITKDLCKTAIEQNGKALKYVPEEYLTKEMCEIAVKNNGKALKFVPEEYITKEICENAVENNCEAIKFVPEEYITVDMCLYIIKSFSDKEKLIQQESDYSEPKEKMEEIFIRIFSYKLKNNKVILDTLIHEFETKWFTECNKRLNELFEKQIKPINFLNEDSKQYVLSKREVPQKYSNLKIEVIEAELPSNSTNTELTNVSDSNELTIYDFANINNEKMIRTIYYITDIHLENQLKNIDKNYHKVCDFIDKKITEALPDKHSYNDILLIGGDVANNIELETLFYERLSKLWDGYIVSILGNHELWDGHPEDTSSGYISRTVEDIVNDYKEQICDVNEKKKIILLHNSLCLTWPLYDHDCYNCIPYTYNKNDILNFSNEELRKRCCNSPIIILGGIGFSGLNPKHNAKSGLYRSAVSTLKEDQEQSQQFRLIYNKLISCAKDLQVIVFTHNPVGDWLDEPCNPNWIYINGHTHQNSIIRNQNGTIILSDNQIGYKPQKWNFKGLSISIMYDPLKDLEDGIHEISKEKYLEFNNARGIYISSFKWQDKIYCLKRNDVYMFILESSKNLCILNGGQIKKLEYDILYYYDKMELYYNKIKQAMQPYYNMLKMISKEVKSFNGDGRIHGCIVDIDYYNHIYLNPFDGKITPYFAYNMVDKYVYNDILSLLKDRIPNLTEKFLIAQKNGNIPILSQYSINGEINKQITSAKVPEMVLDTIMYRPSRTMRSIQYTLEQNVIRSWDDEILTKKLDEKNHEIYLNGNIT